MEPNTIQTASGNAGQADADNDAAADGGWIEVIQRDRPKTNLFSVLTVLWLFPTAGAMVIVALNAPRWFKAGGFVEGLSAIGFEQWIALALIAAHPVFALLAWRYRRTEPYREKVVRVPKPDCDDRNLY